MARREPKAYVSQANTTHIAHVDPDGLATYEEVAHHEQQVLAAANLAGSSSDAYHPDVGHENPLVDDSGYAEPSTYDVEQAEEETIHTTVEDYGIGDLAQPEAASELEAVEFLQYLFAEFEHRPQANLRPPFIAANHDAAERDFMTLEIGDRVDVGIPVCDDDDDDEDDIEIVDKVAEEIPSSTISSAFTRGILSGPVIAPTVSASRQPSIEEELDSIILAMGRLNMGKEATYSKKQTDAVLNGAGGTWSLAASPDDVQMCTSFSDVVEAPQSNVSFNNAHEESLRLYDEDPSSILPIFPNYSNIAFFTQNFNTSTTPSSYASVDKQSDYDEPMRCPELTRPWLDDDGGYMQQVSQEAAAALWAQRRAAWFYEDTQLKVVRPSCSRRQCQPARSLRKPARFLGRTLINGSGKRPAGALDCGERAQKRTRLQDDCIPWVVAAAAATASIPVPSPSPTYFQVVYAPADTEISWEPIAMKQDDDDILVVGADLASESVNPPTDHSAELTLGYNFIGESQLRRNLKRKRVDNDEDSNEGSSSALDDQSLLSASLAGSFYDGGRPMKRRRLEEGCIDSGGRSVPAAGAAAPSVVGSVSGRIYRSRSRRIGSAERRIKQFKKKVSKGVVPFAAVSDTSEGLAISTEELQQVQDVKECSISLVSAVVDTTSLSTTSLDTIEVVERKQDKDDGDGDNTVRVKSRSDAFFDIDRAPVAVGLEVPVETKFCLLGNVKNLAQVVDRPSSPPSPSLRVKEKLSRGMKTSQPTDPTLPAIYKKGKKSTHRYQPYPKEMKQAIVEKENVIPGAFPLETSDEPSIVNYDEKADAQPSFLRRLSRALFGW